MNANQSGAAWNEGGAGHHYWAAAQFLRGDSPWQRILPALGSFDTVVSLAIQPLSGSPIAAGSVFDLRDPDSIFFVGRPAVPVALPPNRALDQVFLRIGDRFGKAGASESGSWIDNLTVGSQFNHFPLTSVGRDGWLLYDDPPPG